MATRRVRTTRVEVSSDRGVFMISVAAELAEMHPQTLRMYEARGLIEPKRSPKGTRLYSQKDVDRLRRIQEMTAELGMNLAGVERVFELEEQLESMSRKVAALEKRAAELGAEVKRLEALRRELRAEIVPYVRGGELVRHADLQRIGRSHPGRSDQLGLARPAAEFSVCNDPSQEEAPRQQTRGAGNFRQSGLGPQNALVVRGVRGIVCASGGGGRLGPAGTGHARGIGPGGAELPLVLPLKADLAGLERFATAVTTIGSPRYGDYLPIAALARRFGASASERSRVLRYLRHEGASEVKIDATGLFADATMKVSLAQRLFGTSLARYQDARAARFVAPATAARIPAALSGRGDRGRRARHAPGVRRAAVDRGRRARPSPHVARHLREPLSVRLRSADRERGRLPGGDRRPRLHAQSVPDRLRLRAAAGCGSQGQDERVALIEIDGFRYSDLRTFASCFGLRGAGDQRLRGRASSTAAARRRDDPRPRGARRRRAGAQGDRRLRVAPQASDVLQSLTAPLQNRHGHVPEVISASLGTCEPALEVVDREQRRARGRGRAGAGGRERDLGAGLQRRRRLDRVHRRRWADRPAGGQLSGLLAAA